MGKRKNCENKGVRRIAELESELSAFRWIPVSEPPDNDTYYIALIGDTGDDFGNTLEWLHFNEAWFYAKNKRSYPRAIFITYYMKISLPEQPPLSKEPKWNLKTKSK